jgi:hypothetical protein
MSSTECSSPRIERTGSRLRALGKIKSGLPHGNPSRRTTLLDELGGGHDRDDLNGGNGQQNCLAQHLTETRGRPVNPHLSKLSERLLFDRRKLRYVHICGRGFLIRRAAPDKKAPTVSSVKGLESVQEVCQGLQSLRSMSRMDASRRKANALRVRFSKSLARRRQRLSQAMVRSTIQRFGRTTNPLA